MVTTGSRAPIRRQAEPTAEPALSQAVIPCSAGWHGNCKEFAAVQLTLSETTYDNN